MVILLLVLVVTARGKYGNNGGGCGRGCCQCKVPVCHDCGCSNSVAAVVFVVSMIGQVVISCFCHCGSCLCGTCCGPDSRFGCR